MEKTEFDATRNPAFARHVRGERPDLVVAGCEAHVCVLQTVLGLLDGKRRVHVVADAIGSRAPDNKKAAIERMARHGAEIVTTEMVVFEWLQSSDHPHFRETVALIK
jgi:nicotinamidase-related amidase